MFELNIAPTQSTPAITSNQHEGWLSIAGDSYPENSFDFFTATLDWIEAYLDNTELPLRLELRLVYMNTSSVKSMMDIFDLLEEANAKGRDVSVDWLYDPRNERVAMLAEEFREDCSFPFRITEQA